MADQREAHQCPHGMTHVEPVRGVIVSAPNHRVAIALPIPLGRAVDAYTQPRSLARIALADEFVLLSLLDVVTQRRLIGPQVLELRDLLVLWQSTGEDREPTRAR